jgi:hypothetical protein
MQNYFSEKDLQRVLGADLKSSSIIDAKMEEAYKMIRSTENKINKKKRKHKSILKGIGIGLSSVAAVLVLTFTFCVMNPVMAMEIPVLGGLFAKVAEFFSFGRLPEEEVTELYTQEALDMKTQEGLGVKTQEALYQKTDNGITISLTEQYASNQAVYVGMCIENEQGFPELQVNPDGSQYLRIKTLENYSFRADEINSYRTVEGKFEDAHTFIGIMRIDYSEIDKDDRKYQEAYRQAQDRGEELALTMENYSEYIDQYQIPETFSMELDISKVVGYLANPTMPEEMKGVQDQEEMTDEEWEAYMKSLPDEWYRFPNSYENWWQDGTWKYDLTITKKDSNAKVIQVNETNAQGIGLESLEISSVEMTLNTIEPVGMMTFAAALDADGNKIESGGENAYELAIEGHDISKVFIYICDYDQYMDELKGYGVPGNGNSKSFQEVLEENALFKTVVLTTE